MSTLLCSHIDALIAKGVEFQVGLRGSPQPLGPAKVERITVIMPPPSTITGTLYRMLVPAQMQATKNSRPANVMMPIVFDADDVLLVIEAPLNQDGEVAVIPSSNGRTPGGLHIPGA